MKLLIGVTGSPLAGKETFANTVARLLKDGGYSASRHTFSGILSDTLDLWGIPHGRPSEQLVAQLMIAPQFFGADTLSNAMRYRLEKDTADVGILDGVRWFSDERMIRGFGERGIKKIIAYVAASPDVRYARLKKRNRAGESAITREEFEKQGKANNEIYIPEIGNRADITLNNDYENVADFVRDIEKAYRESIKPLL
jgi:uridine kinase